MDQLISAIIKFLIVMLSHTRTKNDQSQIPVILIDSVVNVVGERKSLVLVLLGVQAAPDGADAVEVDAQIGLRCYL